MGMAALHTHFKFVGKEGKLLGSLANHSDCAAWIVAAVSVKEGICFMTLVVQVWRI